MFSKTALDTSSYELARRLYMLEALQVNTLREVSEDEFEQVRSTISSKPVRWRWKLGWKSEFAFCTQKYWNLLIKNTRFVGHSYLTRCRNLYSLRLSTFGETPCLILVLRANYILSTYKLIVVASDVETRAKVWLSIAILGCVFRATLRCLAALIVCVWRRYYSLLWPAWDDRNDVVLRIWFRCQPAQLSTA